jgi:hypothetical protein
MAEVLDILGSTCKIGPKRQRQLPRFGFSEGTSADAAYGRGDRQAGSHQGL